MKNSITQKMKYKQSVIKFSFKYGVTKTAVRFDINRRTIYRWIAQYDGTIESLRDKSRKPKHHPNEHTAAEIKLIKDYKKNNKETGLVVLWVKLRAVGYTRTIQGLYHVMRKLGIYEKMPSKAKKTRAPEVPIAKYPGERVQIDVKYVPYNCMSKELREMGVKYYQYTAIDEYTRIRYTYFTEEHSTYESTKFLEKVIKYYPFKIELIQTDNGAEFTNRLSWRPAEKNKDTMFEKKIKELGIKYSLIRPHTPTQNGKVERSHRTGQERFYYKNVFMSLKDLREKGKKWRIEYNNFPISTLGWLSPNQKLLAEYLV